jgi:hypothetical protein
MDQRVTIGNGHGVRKLGRVGQGYGRLQLKLLETLDRYPAFFLIDLLPRPYTRSEYVALHQAAHTLCRRRELDIWKLRGGGSNPIWITRVGYQCAHHEVPRINHAAEAVGYFGRDPSAKSNGHARARMSPEFLEKLRIVGETGELPEEPKPTNGVRRI